MLSFLKQSLNNTVEAIKVVVPKKKNNFYT